MLISSPQCRSGYIPVSRLQGNSKHRLNLPEEILEINDNTFLEKQHEDIVRKQEEAQVKERLIEDNVEMIKDVRATRRDEETDGKVATFLQEKGLSENLVKTLINTGLTNEHVRLLKNLNLSDDDIDNLQDLWQAKIEVDKSSDSLKSTSDSSLSNCHAQLPPNIYLKKAVSKPLIQALCEIVAKKPADPVEYLGHWLLHYKICEERAVQQKQKERKLELSISMEKLQLKKVDDEEGLFIERKDEEDLFIERKNEEEYGEDRNYIDY
ncbi:PREDICTED: uncharacterized protein LOC105562982 isoform X1 [Vollenhovia emeryi]|uniref:uncharacterized protein LOC105562982 isoform X1 n=1 Tax=Vollenhovia emeryi TaxID=411798 RepID=UPI0005F559E7|nr:PREDICTED: uncharacterized protein LOC105562982 isoform X1 [Vollenhovia emeryi]